MKDVTVMITCAGGPGGISMIKSLHGMPGIKRVIGVDADRLSLGLYRDELFKGFLVPNGNDPDYIPTMARIVENEGVNVIIPGSDEEVTAIAKNKLELESLGVRLPISDYKTVRIADDKYLTARAALDNSIPCPASYLLEKGEDLEKIDCDLPVVLRPTYGRGGRGVEYINNREGLAPVFKTLNSQYGPILAQEMIPGGMGSIYLYSTIIDKQQNFRVTYMSRSLRTKFSHGGPGIVGEPLYDGELKKNAEKLLKVIGNWYGPVNVEFKRDERDGILKLLEINPRYWGYSYLSTAAGINFPYLTVKLAMDEPFKDIHEFRTDIVSIRSNEDFIVKKSDLK